MNSTLLTTNDPPPVIHGGVQKTSPFLMICDHAYPHVPKKLRHLGLAKSELERHIAYDLHIQHFAEQLAQLLCCPLISAGYSRLVVETNRPLHDPTSMRILADTTIIPGNINIPASQRQQRIEEIFKPYHHAINAYIAGFSSVSALISMHSFTPFLRKYPNRPKRMWELGILSTRDRRLTDPFLKWIQKHYPECTVGDNEPYSGNDPFFYSIHHHALPAKIPHITFEIRQDIEPSSPQGIEIIHRMHQGILHAVATFS